MTGCGLLIDKNAVISNLTSLADNTLRGSVRMQNENIVTRSYFLVF